MTFIRLVSTICFFFSLEEALLRQREGFSLSA
jgi:hypothetical protein